MPEKPTYASRAEIFREALIAAGHPDTTRPVPSGAATAAEAAAALGCETGAIANSLVFCADGAPILVLSSGRHKVDTVGLAQRLGYARITRAKPDQVAAATGQIIGGVSPVGHPTPLVTIIDESLRDYPDLYAAAGSHDVIFRTDFNALVALTGRRVVRTAE